MNMFAPQCPLAAFASRWYYQPSSRPSRKDWGQDLFHFIRPRMAIISRSREFLCEMAEFWVSEYHVDGFRIDDFKDINNWGFVQEFHDRATAQCNALFPVSPSG